MNILNASVIIMSEGDPKIIKKSKYDTYLVIAKKNLFD